MESGHYSPIIKSHPDLIHIAKLYKIAYNPSYEINSYFDFSKNPKFPKDKINL